MTLSFQLQRDFDASAYRAALERTPCRGLVAQMLRNEKRRDTAKYGKGPAKRVALMAIRQRENISRIDEGLPPVDVRPL